MQNLIIKQLLPVAGETVETEERHEYRVGDLEYSYNAVNCKLEWNIFCVLVL